MQALDATHARIVSQSKTGLMPKLTTAVVNVDYTCSLMKGIHGMRKRPSLGDQEMELLNYISAAETAMTVRTVAAHFESARGLARTTVLTMMERLRKKGFLTRIKRDGVFQYSAKQDAGQVMRDKVADFVRQTLGGSVSPLLNYFIQSSDLSAEEMAQLERLAVKLDAQREGEP